MSESRPPSPSGDRRGAVDVVRVLALIIVVLGHLLLAVIDREGGDIRGANLLELRPGWAWVAALAPMPMFFAAGGWANATASLTGAARRLRSLVGLGAVVVTAWSAGVVGMSATTGDPGIVGDGARIATQPLWFLAAYLPFAAGGARVHRATSARPLLVVGVGLVLLVALDVARFGLDAPDVVGWPGFYVAWGIPWVLGGWWRRRCETSVFDERRAGLALLGGAGAAGVVLVAAFGYHPALIDAVPDTRSNTTPPGLYTAVAAIAQVGVLLVAAAALDRVARRWRQLWDRAGEAAVGIYVWHLSALALCAAAIAGGVPVPDRLTGLWWATRPVWWAAVLGVTMLFVVATARARSLIGGGDAVTVDPPSGRIVVGLVLATAGGAVVGLEGPQRAWLALGCTALFVGGWAALRPRAGVS